jgi:hypothetical protein
MQGKMRAIGFLKTSLKIAPYSAIMKKMLRNTTPDQMEFCYQFLRKA